MISFANGTMDVTKAKNRIVITTNSNIAIGLLASVATIQRLMKML